MKNVENQLFLILHLNDINKQILIPMNTEVISNCYDVVL